MNDTKHKKNRTWSDEEKSSHKEEYGCEILIENGTQSECMTHNAPTDASIVHYIHNDNNNDCIYVVKLKLFKDNLVKIYVENKNIQQIKKRFERLILENYFLFI